MIRIQRFRIYDLVAVATLLSLFLFLLFFQMQWPFAKSKRGLSYCTYNLKQLGHAAALYEGDSGGDRPGPQPCGTEIISWDRPLAIQMGMNLGIAGIDEPLAALTVKPLHPAGKMLAVFTCPDDEQRRGGCMMPRQPGSMADGMAKGIGICRSYSLNLGSGNLAGLDDGIVSTAAAIPRKKIESAAGTVCLIENPAYATVFGQRNIDNDMTIKCTKGEWGINHQGVQVIPKDAFWNSQILVHGVRNYPRVNALMYDGHVEVFEQASVIGSCVMQYIK